jgi:hypothetical protein
LRDSDCRHVDALGSHVGVCLQALRKGFTVSADRDTVEECVRLRALNGALNDALAEADAEIKRLQHALTTAVSQHLAFVQAQQPVPRYDSSHAE